MQSTEYRDSLIEAVRLLDEMEQRLFTAIVNTGMYGVHHQIHESFQLGDVFHFEIGMFEDTGDTNLEELVDLIKSCAGAKARIINLNAIPEDAWQDEDDADEDEQ